MMLTIEGETRALPGRLWLANGIPWDQLAGYNQALTAERTKHEPVEKQEGANRHNRARRCKCRNRTESRSRLEGSVPLENVGKNGKKSGIEI